MLVQAVNLSTSPCAAAVCHGENKYKLLVEAEPSSKPIAYRLMAGGNPGEPRDYEGHTDRLLMVRLPLG